MSKPLKWDAWKHLRQIPWDSFSKTPSLLEKLIFEKKFQEFGPGKIILKKNKNGFCKIFLRKALHFSSSSDQGETSFAHHRLPNLQQLLPFSPKVPKFVAVLPEMCFKMLQKKLIRESHWKLEGLPTRQEKLGEILCLRLWSLKNCEKYLHPPHRLHYTYHPL